MFGNVYSLNSAAAAAAAVRSKWERSKWGCAKRSKWVWSIPGCAMLGEFHSAAVAGAVGGLLDRGCNDARLSWLNRLLDLEAVEV